MGGCPVTPSLGSRRAAGAFYALRSPCAQGALRRDNGLHTSGALGPLPRASPARPRVGSVELKTGAPRGAVQQRADPTARSGPGAGPALPLADHAAFPATVPKRRPRRGLSFPGGEDARRVWLVGTGVSGCCERSLQSRGDPPPPPRPAPRSCPPPGPARAPASLPQRRRSSSSSRPAAPRGSTFPLPPPPRGSHTQPGGAPARGREESPAAGGRRRTRRSAGRVSAPAGGAAGLGAARAASWLSDRRSALGAPGPPPAPAPSL